VRGFAVELNPESQEATPSHRIVQGTAVGSLSFIYAESLRYPLRKEV